MKLKFKNILILPLLVMIVLLVIFSSAYGQKESRSTTYSSTDNRIISILLIEGERDKELLDNCNASFKLLQAKYSTLETKEYLGTVMLTSTLESNKQLTKENEKLIRKNNRLKHYSYVTSGITLILSLILFL